MRTVAIAAVISSVALVVGACGFSVTGGASDPNVTNVDGGHSDRGQSDDDGSSSRGDSGDMTPHDDDGGGLASDADAGTAPPVFAFVQGAHASRLGAVFAATIAPAKAGSFIAVAVTYSNTNHEVLSVIDNAPTGSNTYVSANLKSRSGSCQASEIWFARNVRPLATLVSVVMSDTSGSQNVWAMEASGLAPTGGLDKGLPGNGGSTTVVTTQTVQATGAPAFFVAAVGSCGFLNTIVAGNPFIALPLENGNAAAYHIATTVGPFGPAFNNTNDAWNASVAAFR
jgi:hypothetical protein